jgi:hypothetical protein
MTTIVDMISNNKTTNNFVKEDNINLLWKIIINTPAFKTSIQTNGVEGQQKLRSYYIQHVRTFVEENIYDTSSIMDFNKKFIAYFIKKFQPPSNENTNMTSIDNTKPVTDEVQKLHIDNSNLGKNAITIEELKTERLSDFENRYQQVQNDFDIYRKNEVPADVDFTDKSRDKPINNDEFQQQISTTNEERKTQETTFSKNTDNPTQALKWLNLKEVPKSLVPEPSVFDKPPPKQNIKGTKINPEQTTTNKNDLVADVDAEKNPAVTVKPQSFRDKITPTYLYTLHLQSQQKTEVLSKTVDILKKKIEELEIKLSQIDTSIETHIPKKEETQKETTE